MYSLKVLLRLLIGMCIFVVVVVVAAAAVVVVVVSK